MSELQFDERGRVLTSKGIVIGARYQQAGLPAPIAPHGVEIGRSWFHPQPSRDAERIQEAFITQPARLENALDRFNAALPAVYVVGCIAAVVYGLW